MASRRPAQEPESLENLATVEARLQAILAPYRERLESGLIYGIEVLRRPGAKAHDWFAGIHLVDGAVKLNFLPMHAHPELLDGISPALRKCKTGASVFRFRTLDDALAAEVEAVLRRGFEVYAGLARDPVAQAMADSRPMPDFAAVHARLRAILVPYFGSLSVTRDGPEGVAVEFPGLEGKPWGFVGATRVGKRYVSFYLMSVYAMPDLLVSMSPALRRRKQGKSCFNFTTIDESLMSELEAITAAGMARRDDMLAMATGAEARRR